MRRHALTFGLVSIGLVLVAAPAAGGGGGCHDTEIRQERATTVRMEQACFRPGVVHVDTGDTVTVVNEDTMLHNLYGQDWYAGDLAPGAETTRTFEEPGVYAFTCTLHPGMAGAVVVGGGAVELAAAGLPTGGGDAGGGGGAAVTLTLGGVAAAAAAFAAGRYSMNRRDGSPTVS